MDTDFDGCMAMVKQLAREPGIYLANSMNSLRVEGQKTVSIEIVQQFDWDVPDWVIIPGGNLGNTAALGAGFLMMRELGLIQKLPRIAVAQAERANPLYQSFMRGFDAARADPWPRRPWPRRSRSATRSATRRRCGRCKRFDGVVEQATEDELAQAAARADRTGMFTDPHTGVALAVLEKLVARGEIQPAERVVVDLDGERAEVPGLQGRATTRGTLEGIGGRATPTSRCCCRPSTSRSSERRWGRWTRSERSQSSRGWRQGLRIRRSPRARRRDGG